MTTYSFKITKGKYQLSLTTTDRDMIVDQFEKWVRKASEYTQKNANKEAYDYVNAQINSEKDLMQRKIDEQLKRFKTVENEKIEEKETFTNETQRNLDVFYAPPKKEEKIQIPIENAAQTSVQNNFENLLDKSIHKPQTELSFRPSPTIKKDNAFLNYMGGRKIERKMDYLLLTAYYFTQYEQKPRFTVKQLNAKLMQNLAVIIDHSVIQEALNRDYIECLPDLTGVVGSSEYRLTAYGEKMLMEQG